MGESFATTPYTAIYTSDLKRAQASIAAFKRTLASAKPAAKAAPASSSVVSKTPQSEKAPSKSQTPAPFSKTDRCVLSLLLRPFDLIPTSLLSSPLPISTTTQSASTINESITDTKHEPPKSCKSAELPINLNSWRPPPLFGTA